MRLQHVRTLVRKLVPVLIVASGQAALFPHIAAAQSARGAFGIVRDQIGQGVPGVQIMVKGVKAPVTTDADGRFEVPGLSSLTYFVARGAGHFPTVELIQPSADTVEIRLETLGTRSDTAAVLGEAERELTRASQRYERATRSARTAKAFTNRDIDRRAPAVTTDMLVGVVGFIVAGSGTGARIISGRDGCSPTIFVDEVEKVNFSLNEVRPSAIRLLLAYNGYAVIPAHLRSTRVDPTCGAIAVLMK